jgi:hypothetical protein
MPAARLQRGISITTRKTSKGNWAGDLRSALRILRRFVQSCAHRHARSRRFCFGNPIEAHRGLGGTGVVGVLKGRGNGGKRTGLRADMDAADAGKYQSEMALHHSVNGVFPSPPVIPGGWVSMSRSRRTAHAPERKWRAVMKKFLVVVIAATLLAPPFSSAAFAGPPGAFYQQQQSGYPQSPPGGGY